MNGNCATLETVHETSDWIYEKYGSDKNALRFVKKNNELRGVSIKSTIWAT